MTRDIESLTKEHYDLIVIGGGINGCAIAYLASRRGLKTLLLEKGDFASGTSSKSTKLIHGGIRYLENLEFDLVRESLKERFIQLKAAPHLVKPLPFIIPVYKGDKRPLWFMKLGVFLYDLLAGRYAVKKHQNLRAKEILRLEPNLRREGLQGGVIYYDAQMDDARLCLENALSAVESGAKVLNYIEVTALLKQDERAIGVRMRDVFTQKIVELRANRIVCCLGPWTNAFLRLDNLHARKAVRNTKGVHIVYKGRLTNHAMLLTSGRDKRVFFVIPWLGNSLIGTTDTDYIGKPDNVKAEPEDIAYLMEETKRVFPTIILKEENILTTFAGLRPLYRSGGVKPSKASRQHQIFETGSGLIFVIGGKYTTYRKIAEDCLNRFTPVKHEHDYQLYGSGKIAEKAEDIAQAYGLEIDSVKALFEKYGTRYENVLKLIEQNPQLKKRFCSCNPFIKAQIVYSIETEMAQTADDIISRRLSLCYYACKTKECEKIIHEFIRCHSS